MTELPNLQGTDCFYRRELRRQSGEHHYRFPYNRSRQQINQAVRVELQTMGVLSSDDRKFKTLAHRRDLGTVTKLDIPEITVRLDGRKDALSSSIRESSRPSIMGMP